MIELRVTEVLSIVGAADYTWGTDEDQWRGSSVHDACLYHDRGWQTELVEPWRGYLEAYIRFERENRVAPHPGLMEQPLRKEVDGIMLKGTPDRFMTIAGEHGPLDIKTGDILPAHELQVTLYGYLYDPEVWWPRFALRLRKDGTYRLERWSRVSYPQARANALAAVRVAAWKKRNGLA